jgi:hypothetical protein
MSKVKVSAGACGFTVVIKAEKNDKNKLKLKIASPCEMIKNLAKELDEVSGDNVFLRINDSEIYKIASKHIKHPACPVPAAILKAIEVEMGFALPKDVTMTIEK